MNNSNTADEDDEYEFKPSFEDASSIILLTICVVSTLASLFVSYSIFKIGGQTASSKVSDEYNFIALIHVKQQF